VKLDTYENADARPPAALSPDGRTLFTARGNGSLEIWDLPSQTVRTPHNQMLGPVHSLAFTPDGHTFITGTEAPVEEFSRREVISLGPLGQKDVRWENLPLRSPASTVRLWDLASGTEKERLPGPGTMTPPGLVALAPAGPTLAAGSRDGSVWLWDRSSAQLPARRFISPAGERYASKEELIRKLLGARPEYQESLQSVALSPDGRLLAAASDRGVVTLWEADGWQVRHTWVGTASDSPRVAFSPDNKTLAVARSGQVQLRDADAGDLRRTLGEAGGASIECVAFNAAGTLLAAGYSDRSIRLWDLGTGRQSAPLIGHRDRVAALAFSPDGKTLASASWDRTVRLWNVAARQEVATLEAHHEKVHCVAFSPDGSMLASGGETPAGGGEVYLWRGPPP
jgi:WD40 repeat protein